MIERLVLLHDGEVIHAHDIALGGPTGGVLEGTAGVVRVDFSQGPVSFALVERTLIVEALTATGGNRRRAAELLDISVETLRDRLEKYGLTPASPVSRVPLAG